jgi:hypothetical protein
MLEGMTDAFNYDPRIPQMPPEPQALPPLLTMTLTDQDIPLVGFRSADKRTINRLASVSFVLAGLVAILIVAQLLLFFQGQNNKAAVLANRIVGYKIDGLVCQVAADQHETIPASCDTPNVSLYWSYPPPASTSGS